MFGTGAGFFSCHEAGMLGESERFSPTVKMASVAEERKFFPEFSYC